MYKGEDIKNHHASRMRHIVASFITEEQKASIEKGEGGNKTEKDDEKKGSKESKKTETEDK